MSSAGLLLGRAFLSLPRHTHAAIDAALLAHSEPDWFNRCTEVLNELVVTNPSVAEHPWAVFTAAIFMAPDSRQSIRCLEEATYLLGRMETQKAMRAAEARKRRTQAASAASAPRPARRKFTDQQLIEAFERDKQEGRPPRGRAKRLGIDLQCDRSTVQARLAALKMVD